MQRASKSGDVMVDGQLLLPAVQRVESGLGSHIEPPMSETWSERDKLAWHAAVCALDSGLVVEVRDVDGKYSLAVINGGVAVGTGQMSYHDAWTYLNGASAGAVVMAAQD